MRRAPAFVSRGGIKLANALAASGLEVRGPPRARRGRLDGRLHRLPAAARRARGDRGRRRLRRARLEPAHRPARARARAHQRARADPSCCRRAAWPDAPGSGDDRRVVHLAGEGAAARCSAAWPARYDVLALVKPQFEVGRGRVGKGGVVRDAGDRREALVAVGEAALALGARVLGYHSSGLPGPKGNRETFIWLDRARARGDAESELAASSSRWRGRWSREGDRRCSPTGAPRTPTTALRELLAARPRRRRDAAAGRGGDAQARPRGGPGRRAERAGRGRRRAVRGARRRRHDPAALQRYAGTGVPVFAINFGEIGFLATVEPAGPRGRHRAAR